MKALERHRKIWVGKSDEWIFERIDLELKDKVNTIHELLERVNFWKVRCVIVRIMKKD